MHHFGQVRWELASIGKSTGERGLLGTRPRCCMHVLNLATSQGAVIVMLTVLVQKIACRFESCGQKLRAVFTFELRVNYDFNK
jgi:hypothetical protein